MVSRTCLLVFFFLSTSLACNSSVGQGLEKQILGAWVGNVEASKKFWKENQIKGSESVLQDADKTYVTFEKERGFHVFVNTNPKVGDNSIKGTYEVLQVNKEKKSLKLKFIPNSPEGPDEIEILVQLVTVKMQTTLVISPANNQPLVFFKKTKDRKKDKTNLKKTGTEKN